MKDVIDGSKAARQVKKYFEEMYTAMGVILFEVEKVEFDETEKIWKIECSFFRTFATSHKSYYSVIVYADGTIGPHEKIVKKD